MLVKHIGGIVSMITKTRTISLTKRAIHNYIFQKPFCVSFEITHNCNAKCTHCHLGGHVDEQRASPERLGQICRELNPLIAQLSGGEPLLRKDVEDIVRAFRRPNRAPYIDITTNGFLLTREKYDTLLHAGIDQFGISLDYPDDRHDTFRGIPGLFHRIETLIEGLNGENDKAITLLCVIQRDNFRDLIRMVELANDWNVKINFSTYTWLRTDDKTYLLAPQEIEEFRQIVTRLMELREKYQNIFTSRYVFDMMIKFFENHSTPNCRTGVKFFNVNPNGTISPCGLIIKNYGSQKELREKFSCTNSCTYCYTSIRANTEKPLYHLLRDNIQGFQKY